MDIKFYKTLARVAIPIIVQEFINSFVNILDTFMIGSLGVHEITAVGLANQVFFLFILFVFGINSGAAILMGQYWGAGDVKSIKKTLGICMLASVIASVIFSLLAIFVPEVIMGVYSKDSKVIEIGSSYLSVIWVSYILCALTMPFATALKSIRQTKIPMLTTVIALLCNALLNYIFIFILHMGVIGAALGTVIARFAELTAILIIAYGYKLPIAANFKELLYMSKKFVKDYIFVATPVVLNESIWALGTSIYNIAYKHCGTEAQGALQIANSVQNMFMVVGIGAGFGCGIIIANTLGAGEIDNAIRYSRRIMKLSVVTGMIMGALLLIMAPFIVNIFNVTDFVKDNAVKIMIVIAASLFAKVFNFTTIVGILRNGGDTWFCFLLDSLSVWCVGVPFAFLGALVLGLPIYYVVALVSLEEVFKMLFSGYRVNRLGWARKIV